MERNANYALVGAISLALFMGLVIFAVWLAKISFTRDYDLYDILFVGHAQSRRDQELSLGNENVLTWVRTGQDQGMGYVWNRIFGRRSLRPQAPAK